MPKKKKGKSKKGKRRNYADVWDPSKGDTLEGEIVRMEDGVETRFGESGVLEIEDEDGDRFAVWCGDEDKQSGLRILFDAADEGDSVSITFVKKEKGQFGRKIYEVELEGDELDLEYDDDD